MSTELLMLFDLFYFVNGRFPSTTAHTFIPRGNLPMEVNGKELNIKKLYEKFRGTNSHGLVSSLFLAGLNIFFSGDPEIRRKFLTEFYQNMTVNTFLTENSFTFDAFTDLVSRINILLRGLGNTKTETIEKNDENNDLKLKKNTNLTIHRHRRLIHLIH